MFTTMSHGSPRPVARRVPARDPALQDGVGLGQRRRPAFGPRHPGRDVRQLLQRQPLPEVRQEFLLTFRENVDRERRTVGVDRDRR